MIAIPDFLIVLNLMLEEAMKRWRFLFAALGVIGPILVFVFVTVLGVFWRSYDPISGYVSDLAASSSPFRFVFDIFGFGLFGVIMAGFALVLDRHLKAGRISKIATQLFLGGSFFIIVLAIFPTDLEGVVPTLDGQIHTLFGSIAFFMFSISLIWYARAFGRESEWEGIWQPLSLVLGILAFFGSSIIFFFPHIYYVGTIERLAIGAVVLWMFFVSINLLFKESL